MCVCVCARARVCVCVCVCVCWTGLGLKLFVDLLHLISPDLVIQLNVINKTANFPAITPQFPVQESGWLYNTEPVGDPPWFHNARNLPHCHSVSAAKSPNCFLSGPSRGWSVSPALQYWLEGPSRSWTAALKTSPLSFSPSPTQKASVICPACYSKPHREAWGATSAAWKFPALWEVPGWFRYSLAFIPLPFTLEVPCDVPSPLPFIPVFHLTCLV